MLKYILIGGGLCLLGYAAGQKGTALYHQHRLRQAYLETEYKDLGEPSLPLAITEDLPMRLIIPKINLDLIVLYGDVFDPALQNKGPVFFEMSDRPGTEGGNVVISGHRGSFWGFFTDLDRLEERDEIYLDIGGYRFIYSVEWSRIVEPGDWSLIQTTAYPALTLQTCEPKNRPATHRLFVRAALDSVTRPPG